MASSTIPENMKARLKASYDAMAATYNTWTERHHDIRLRYLDELCTLAPKLTSKTDPSTVLELGCGSGRPFLDTLLSRGPLISATANELSDTQLELARTNLAHHNNAPDGTERVRFVSGDMASVSFPPGSLTVVAALYSLIHLPQDEQAEMLGRAAGWLEPGGCLLVNLAVDETKGIVFERWLHDKGWMFWSGLGQKVTEEKLTEGGLTIEKSQVEGDTQEKFLWIIARKPEVSAGGGG